MWQKVVFITKGYVRYSRVIGLVKVLWKITTGILNRRLMSEIVFHDVLRGFWVGRGTETAPLKANMLQHLTNMREAIFHNILLYLQKSYDVL